MAMPIILVSGMNTTVATQAPQASQNSVTTERKLSLRTGASEQSSLIAQLTKGSIVKYDAYAVHDGYVWLR